MSDTPENLGEFFFNVILNFRTLSKIKPYFDYQKKIKGSFYRFGYYQKNSFGIYKSMFIGNNIKYLKYVMIDFENNNGENNLYTLNDKFRAQMTFDCPPKFPFYNLLYASVDGCIGYGKTYLYKKLFCELNDLILNEI